MQKFLTLKENRSTTQIRCAALLSNVVHLKQVDLVICTRLFFHSIKASGFINIQLQLKNRFFALIVCVSRVQ